MNKSLHTCVVLLAFFFAASKVRNIRYAGLPSGKYYFFQTPQQGADNSIYVALSPELEGKGGRYFVNCQSTQSSDESYREDVQKRLWKVSCELAGIPK